MYFLPEFGSAPILMNELATYLAQKGHDVEVVTTMPRGSKNSQYNKRLYIKEHKDGFTVIRFLTNTTPHPIGRFIAWTIYTCWTVLNVLRIGRGDIMFLRSPPLQLGLTGLFARKLKNARAILNVQDIHPDLAIESGILKNRLAIKVVKKFEKWIYDKVNEIVVISDGFRKNLSKKGVSNQKITVIPNWVDCDFLKPYSKNNYMAQRLNLVDKFTVMYSGTITISSFLSLKRIIEVASQLRDDDDITFVIVGDGLKKHILQEKISELALNNVNLLPFQQYGDLPYLLAASDILIVPLDEDKSVLSVPSKLYNYMAAGRPILCLAEKEAEPTRIINDARCGVTVAPDCIDEISDTIKKLKSSKKIREYFGKNARIYAVENFSKAKILQKYENFCFRSY